MQIVIASGGFDPLHLGHLKYLKSCANLTNRGLYVIVNNDNWLKAKKNYNLLPEKDRLAIIRSLEFVEDAVLSKHQPNTDDLSINKDLERVHRKLIKIWHWTNPEFILANGGDRTEDNIPEIDTCKRLGIKLRFGVGGKKISSSSDLFYKAVWEDIR